VNLGRRIVTNRVGTLLCSCVKVREAINLLFGEVSGVGRRVRILDGVFIWQGDEVVYFLGGRFSHWFEWRFEYIFKTEMYSTQAWKVDNILI